VLLGIAVPGLRPRRALYVDPAWHRRRGDLPLTAQLPRTPGELGPAAERWSPEDVAVDLASNARLDPVLGGSLFGGMGPDDVIAAPEPGAGATLLVPELDPVLPVSAHALLEQQGYVLKVLDGVRHVMHRDDPEAFLAVLRDELAVEAVA
jgi:pimeloyl-ACP methyl ester carboxylesterase